MHMLTGTLLGCALISILCTGEILTVLTDASTGYIILQGADDKLGQFLDQGI
jgi:hypothetical protein